MAGNTWFASSGRTIGPVQSKGQISVTGTTETCVMTLTAPSYIREKITKLEVFFFGVTSTNAPVDVVLALCSDGGTGGAALVVDKVNQVPETLQLTGKTAIVTPWSVLPTKSSILAAPAAHPQGGLIEWEPMGNELWIPGGGILGVFITAANTVGVRVGIRGEE